MPDMVLCGPRFQDGFIDQDEFIHQDECITLVRHFDTLLTQLQHWVTCPVK